MLPFPSVSKLANSRRRTFGFGGGGSGTGGLSFGNAQTVRRALGAVVALTLVYALYANAWRATAKLPPNYRVWAERERALPQNSLSLPYPQGRNG